MVSGTNEWNGRVEVFNAGTWGTVCHNNWDLVDAGVVCKSFGYPGTVAVYDYAHFGEGTGDIWLDEVQCDGTESWLLNCHHSPFGTEKCGHWADAGVECEPTGKAVSLTSVWKWAGGGGGEADISFDKPMS